MKPAAFTYHRPRTVDDATRLLADLNAEDARILAGGQSLMPIMAFRLAQPKHLIDINSIEELGRLHVEDGKLIVGATVRHATFHNHVAPGVLGHLLSEVVNSIAHYPIRTRGTFCGSLVHADPASEWCLVAVTLGAELILRHSKGARALAASEFLQSAMVTAIESDEILTQAHLPILPEKTCFGFAEFNRTQGDFALAMALAAFRVEEGAIVDARFGVGGVEDRARRITEIELMLTGRVPSEDLFLQAASVAAEAVEPLIDPQISERYRRQLVRETAFQALMRAVERSHDTAT